MQKKRTKDSALHLMNMLHWTTAVTCVLTCSMKCILQLCLAGSMPAEKGVEQTLLLTDQSLVIVKAARAFSAVGLFVTKMQSSRSDQTIDILSSRQNYFLKLKNGSFFLILSLFLCWIDSSMLYITHNVYLRYFLMIGNSSLGWSKDVRILPTFYLLPR